MKKILIIGAGASGLMAAYTAAKSGAEVVIFEKKNKIASKLLATGNGHCNFTNVDLKPDYYYDIPKNLLEDAFSIFDNNDTIDFFEEIGVPCRYKGTYLYPYNMEATSVVNAFINVLNRIGIKIYKEQEVLSIKKYKSGWNIITDMGDFYADSIIISCGTNASYKKDISGNIFNEIKKMGIRCVPQAPALTYLKVREKDILLASGVRFPVNISLFCDNKLIKKESGELQISSKGISGICAFQLSRYVSRNADKSFSCSIDYMPEYSFSDIKYLISKKLSSDYLYLREIFNGILPGKLILALAKISGLDTNKKYTSKNRELSSFISVIKKCILNIQGTGEVFEAQCLTGGVDVKEINFHTMEAKKHKGLFFTGEIVDVDGMCGGYNLQWAWTSGYIAGLNASKE